MLETIYPATLKTLERIVSVLPEPRNIYVDLICIDPNDLQRIYDKKRRICKSQNQLPEIQIGEERPTGLYSWVVVSVKNPSKEKLIEIYPEMNRVRFHSATWFLEGISVCINQFELTCENTNPYTKKTKKSFDYIDTLSKTLADLGKPPSPLDDLFFDGIKLPPSGKPNPAPILYHPFGYGPQETSVTIGELSDPFKDLKIF